MPPSPRKLILSNGLSPGDIVVLTAAVRDLHLAYPGRFLTDVRTPCAALWESNPYITRVDDADPAARTLRCEYPLIHRSNRAPFHFIHGFRMDLEQKLQLSIPATAFQGDIHISEKEKSWMSQVEEIRGPGTRFWILVAGGKSDFTIKWWSTARFQEVVDRLRDRVLFVQVGAAEHRHPPLEGVLDLRGRTDLRQLVRLVYHSDGLVCPVTLLMHLASAVPTRPGRPASRPCVVVAGGREPPQWEAYPQHRFLHTSGALPCCASGGCWRSRVVPLGDGDAKDAPDQLCVDVRDGLPRCMDMIRPSHVVDAVLQYFEGGILKGPAEAPRHPKGHEGATSTCPPHDPAAEPRARTTALHAQVP